MNTTNSSKPLQNPLVWVAGLVLIAAIVAGAIALAGGSDDEVSSGGSAFETAPVQIIGDVLPRYAEPDSAVGTPVPIVAGLSFDGEAVTIGGDGKPRLYGFFAHWCPHCQAELPETSAWLAENDLPGDVDFIAVSTGVSADADNFPPSEWFDREEWPDDVVVDNAESSIARAFGLPAYPYWVGTDSDGNVAFRSTGGIGPAQLEALLEALAQT